MTVVVVAGLLAIGASAWELLHRPFRAEWLTLAALTLLTGSFSIKLPSVNARISVSEAFVFVAVLLFGPAVATIVVALDTIVLTSWTRNARRSPLRALFNVSAGATAIWLASHLFEFLLPTTTRPAQLEELLLPVLALALSYFALNSSLIAIAVGHEKATSPIEVWHRNFAWLSLNYLGGASVAMLLVTYRRDIDLTALSVIVPLMVITYLTFRTSLARLEDAQHHLAQLNALYMSTVETLAMAVDAKDQITHGHIRRVQVYAVELAKRLGVSDDSQLRAIEAAALLHDLGKLAIPEHILNKPGKLTSAEFDKMKRHANIGADLLSSIKFPYPVVPIVRHHHESWDGSGYPARISGGDIPIGARILAVVDCFDALTSDRPYRPRLQPEEAFSIIRERRGSMYDPLVVDAFISSYAAIAPAAALAGQEAKSLVPPLYGPDDEDQPFLDDIRNNAAETVALSQLARELESSASLSSAVAAANQYVRLLTPAAACAFFKHDSRSDALICTDAAGDKAHLLVGMSIKTGERITGWVAANDRVIVNSDATLDLHQLASRFSPALRSSIAVPVRCRGAVFGVVTAYGTEDGAFQDNHKYLIEQIAVCLSERIEALAPTKLNPVVRFPSL